MTDVYETPAGRVRTGQVIKVRVDGYRTSLEVEIVHHASAVVDGTREPVVWFTGWTSQGVRVERGWGQSPDTLVMVVEDLRGYCYGTVETADVSDLAYLLTSNYKERNVNEDPSNSQPEIIVSGRGKAPYCSICCAELGEQHDTWCNGSGIVKVHVVDEGAQ